MNIKEFIELLACYPGEAKVELNAIMVLSSDEFTALKARYGKRIDKDDECRAPDHMKILPTDLQLAGVAYDPGHRKVRFLAIAPDALLEQVDLPQWSPEIEDKLEHRYDESSESDLDPPKE